MLPTAAVIAITVWIDPITPVPTGVYYKGTSELSHEFSIANEFSALLPVGPPSNPPEAH